MNHKTLLALSTFLFAVPGLASSHETMMMEMNAAMMDMHKDMQELKASGNNEVDYMKMMIPHHKGAIEMSKRYLKYGKDRVVRARAEKIIEDQEREIEEMEKAIKEASETQKKSQ